MFRKNKKQTETIKEPKEKKVRTFKVNVTKLRLLYDKNIIKKVGEIVSSAFFAFQGQHK